MLTTYVLILSVLGCFGFLIQGLAKSKKFPPGPPTKFLIGNLHQAPTSFPERTYRTWADIYGPILGLRYGLQNFIVLGSNSMAREVLDKRSNIYSSRPRMIMLSENISRGLDMVFFKYGKQLRQHQRLQASYLNPRAANACRPLQDLESKQLVFELLSTNDFRPRLHRLSAGVVYALAYGTRVPRGDEPELKDCIQAVANFNTAACITNWIVDVVPPLNHLPRILAPWKHFADKIFNFESSVHLKNFEEAIKRPNWNWCKQALERPEAKLMPHVELVYDIGILFLAASDTTTITMDVFIMAAILHPNLVKKAQAELDQVVGNNRLPTFDDQNSLPYVKAFILETQRWKPIAPLGVPHAVDQDDEYMGYLIPKGSIVVPNMWALTREEGVFNDPEAFVPERWIENPDLPVSTFGYGRRICPGRHLAANTLFIEISRMLWTFDFGHAYEEVDGVMKRIEIDPDHLIETGFATRPAPFQASLKPRSPHHEEVVRSEWASTDRDTGVILEKMHQTQLEMRGKA